MVKKITGDEFNEVRNSKLAVVDFSATWCGPCKMLGPVIEQVSEEMADKAAFYNVDVDDDQDIAEEFGIMSIPAVLVFKEGKVVENSVGFRPKEDLIKLIEGQV